MIQAAGRCDTVPSPIPSRLRIGRHCLLSSQPLVMGILNVTPDSFSDGGQYASLDAALARARAMVAAGARIVDVGGESTRPGSNPVPVEEELRRVVPVISAIRRHLDCIVSVDSRKPEVMDAACAAGAQLINDVEALQAPGAIEVARRHDVAVCLMHMRGQPRSMQQAPAYDDVVAEVHDFLAARLAACVAGGIDAERVILDPGIGFGKRLEHNLALLANLHALAPGGRPILIGASRKSLFGQLLNAPLERRMAGGLAVASIAVWQGAMMLRSHDVAETFDAIHTAQALRCAHQRGTAAPARAQDSAQQ